MFWMFGCDELKRAVSAPAGFHAGLFVGFMRAPIAP